MIDTLQIKLAKLRDNDDKKDKLLKLKFIILRISNLKRLNL